MRKNSHLILAGLCITAYAPSTFAITNACDGDPALNAVKDVYKELSTQKLLNNPKNCAHPQYGLDVENSKKSIGKNIDEFWAKLDRKAVKAAISDDSEKRIGLLVPGEEQKKPEDFGLTPDPAGATRYKGFYTFLQNNPNPNSNSETPYHAITSMVDNFMGRQGGKAGDPERVKKLNQANLALSERDGEEFLAKLPQDQALRAKLESAAQKRSCSRGYGFEMVPEMMWRNQLLEEAASKGRKRTGFGVAEVRDALRKDVDSEEVLTCTEPVLKKSRVDQYELANTVEIDAKAYFEDNQYHLKDPSILNAKISEKLKDSPGCQVKAIKGIRAVGYSSQYRDTCLNSDRPECKGCTTDNHSEACFAVEEAISYAHQDLNKRRAMELANVAKKVVGQNVPVVLDTSGDNGDGTKGVCPYTKNAQDQVELKERYKTPEGRAEMKENRGAKLYVDTIRSGPNCDLNQYGGHAGDYDPTKTDSVYLSKKCFKIKVVCQ